MHVMFLHGNSVTHIADTVTRVSAENCFVSYVSNYKRFNKGVCLELVINSCFTYTWYSCIPRAEQGSIPTSVIWKPQVNVNGIQLRLSGIHAHCSLSIDKQ